MPNPNIGTARGTKTKSRAVKSNRKKATKGSKRKSKAGRNY